MPGKRATFLFAPLILLVIGPFPMGAEAQLFRPPFQMPDGDCFAPCEEIIGGGPPKDGIPALSDPNLLTVEESEERSWPFDDDVVLGVIRNGEAIAVPLPILFWHEIVNTTLGGDRSAITYCPLTGSGLHFDGVFSGGGTDFGVSGALWRNNLTMYNRSGDETWWSQMWSQGIAGVSLGERLVRLPAVETTWKTWRTLVPDTLVVSNITGFARFYDIYPYGSYEDLDEPPFVPLSATTDSLKPVNRVTDPAFPPKLRVLGFQGQEGTRTYPFSEMDPESAIDDMFEGEPILIVHHEPSRLALGYSRRVNGELLTFAVDEDGTFPFGLRDEQTGSVWNVLGQAVSGPMEGRRLTAVADSYIAFWFAWAAFFPEPEIYRKGSEIDRLEKDAVSNWTEH